MEPLDLEGVRTVNGRLMGRVSHISGYRVPDERVKSQQALADWRAQRKLDHPELPDDFYSQRGTMFHSAAEHRLITGEDPTHIHEWAEPFYKKARPIFSQYGNVYWAERPVDDSINWPDELAYQTEEGETRYHVWHSLGYVGTPDLVVRWRGCNCLIDWKTSETLYNPVKPRFSRSTSMTVEAELIRKKKINGWYKYTRTVRQLAAYTMALEERIDMPGFIDMACINVITLDHGIQQLPIYRVELLGKPWEEFKHRLSQWRAEHNLV